jgi:hypothetical protein
MALSSKNWEEQNKMSPACALCGGEAVESLASTKENIYVCCPNSKCPLSQIQLSIGDWDKLNN